MTAIWKLHYTKMDKGKTIFFSKWRFRLIFFGTVTHCSRLAMLQNGGSRPILFAKGGGMKEAAPVERTDQ
ncbi:hypothetical protein HED63_08705 [Ochrobactrum cytisi]|nr:hypothetical protein [Brucella cytisi]